jgi:acyl dehydratase
MERSTTYFEDVNEGDEFSGSVENISRSHFVRYAGASGDFNPMHHDDSIATAVGYPSVFGHGMFTAGVLSHYVTDWFGIGNLRKFGTNFKGQLYPGRTLTLTAKVVRKYKHGDANLVDAELSVVDDQGSVIVTGNATAALPSKA